MGEAFKFMALTRGYDAPLCALRCRICVTCCELRATQPPRKGRLR